MINHPVGELFQELAVVFFIQAAPCLGIALQGFQGGSQALLKLMGQILADAAIVRPASVISSLASSV